MRDIESRLRAAMHSVTDQPPGGLLDGVRRRNRRHRERVAVCCAVAVVAIAVGAQPVANALRASGPSPAGALPGVRTGREARLLPFQGVNPGGRMQLAHPRPAAAAGTVLAGCRDADTGSIGTDWRRVATRLAGNTLWFISGGRGSASGQTLNPGVIVIVGAKPGATVIAKVAASGQGRLRFLYGPDDSLAAGTRYTRRSGERGVTFVACTSRAAYEPQPRNVTTYYGAFLYKGCAPVNVWLPGRRSPVHIRLGDCR